MGHRRGGGERAPLPSAAPGAPSPVHGGAAGAGPGAGAGRRGFAVGFTRRFMRGRAAGSSHRCFPGEAWGLPEVALSTNPPEAEREEGNPPSPDSSGSGGASREARGRKERGKGPAAPRQSSSPFPISLSDVAGTARAPVSFCRPFPPAARLPSCARARRVGEGIGAAPPGRVRFLQALACLKPVTRDTDTLAAHERCFPRCTQC